MSHERNKSQSVSHRHRKCSLPNACQKWIPEDKTTRDSDDTNGSETLPKPDSKTITIMMIIATIARMNHRVGKDRLVGLGQKGQSLRSEIKEWDVYCFCIVTVTWWQFPVAGVGRNNRNYIKWAFGESARRDFRVWCLCTMGHWPLRVTSRGIVGPDKGRRELVTGQP